MRKLYRNHFFPQIFKSFQILRFHYSSLHLSFSLGNLVSKLGVPKSSFDEFIGKSKENFCKKEIILEQFKTPNEYEIFSYDSLEEIVKRKNEDADAVSELNTIFIEG